MSTSGSSFSAPVSDGTARTKGLLRTEVEEEEEKDEH